MKYNAQFGAETEEQDVEAEEVLDVAGSLGSAEAGGASVRTGSGTGGNGTGERPLHLGALPAHEASAAALEASLL